MISNEHNHNYLLGDEVIKKNFKKTSVVVFITAAMMVVEIIAGYLTSSMSLLADGWHMASHAAALGISLIAYKVASSEKVGQMFSFGAGKVIPLGGYTSAIVLTLIAILMGYHSIDRLFNPLTIHFDEAIFVAILGLIVNVVCVIILFDHHHHGPHEHTHDHNIKSAYVHVIADAMTSLFAIAALFLGKFYNWVWADPIMGIVGSIIILRWAYLLCKETAWELLDGHAKIVDHNEVRIFLESEGFKVEDLHIWRIAPKAHACEIVISNKIEKGSQYYRDLLNQKYKFEHLIIEERQLIV